MRMGGGEKQRFLPRPSRGALGDLWAYLRQGHAHKWPLLGLSAAMTWLMLWVFIFSADTGTEPRRNKIIYFQNWRADRSDVEILMQQKRDLALNEARLLDRQEDMQKLADMLGIEWREEEARNTARRKEILKQINDKLDERLAKALAEAGTRPERSLSGGAAR